MPHGFRSAFVVYLAGTRLEIENTGCAAPVAVHQIPICVPWFPKTIGVVSVGAWWQGQIKLPGKTKQLEDEEFHQQHKIKKRTDESVFKETE